MGFSGPVIQKPGAAKIDFFVSDTTPGAPQEAIKFTPAAGETRALDQVDLSSTGVVTAVLTIGGVFRGSLRTGPGAPKAVLFLVAGPEAADTDEVLITLSAHSAGLATGVEVLLQSRDL